MPKKGYPTWDNDVHKIFVKRPLNYKKLAELAPLVDGRYSVTHFHYPDRLLYIEAKGIDFTKSKFSPICGFGFVKLENCVFDQMKYDGNINGHFTKCSFRKVSFPGAGFVTGDNKFLECDFSGSKFRSFTGRTGIFENCSFDDCLFSNTDFFNCHFIQCSFRNVKFDFCSLGGSRFVDLKSNLEWIEDPPGVRRSFQFVGADNTADLSDTLMGETTFVDNRVKKAQKKAMSK